MAAWTVPRLLVLVQLLLISGGAVSARAQVNRSIRSYKVIEDSAVYTFPSETSRQIASIPAGTTVHVVGSLVGKWARIQSQQGRPFGYIKTSSLAITESSSESRETPNEFRRNPQASSLRSKESRIRTEIEFNNRLSAPIAIYWVDFQGNEIPFGDLAPGSSKVIQTFATHPWLVRDKRTGQVLRTIVPGSARELVIIDKVPPTSQSASREPQRSPSVAQQPSSLKSQEVCTGDSIQLNQNETVAVTFKRGCQILRVSFPRGDVEETALWPSGRTTKIIRRQPVGEFSYPEWPPSVISFKAITPASISFLAQKTTPVQQPPKSSTPQIQAQSQRQPLPGLPGIRTPAQTSSRFTTDDYLMLALAVIIGCGLLYAIILAVKTPSPFVKGNWSTLIENFQASPKEFYVSVERAIASRQVPDINKSRVDWKEGGLITAFREYLRISREKLVFDICAAPYGTGFFISWWLAELRPSAIGPTLVVLGIVFLLYDRLAFYFGFATASIYTLIGLILIVLLLGILVNRSPGANWVRYVLVIPLIGKMIERFFMPPTYYRMDTEAMFKASIEQSVKEVLNQMLQAKGLRALTELELKPIMRDFFQK